MPAIVKHALHEIPGRYGRLRVEVICPQCKEPHSVEVDAGGYTQWMSRRLLIQEALPDLSPDEHELLMTGIDSKCWNELWKEEEEE